MPRTRPATYIAEPQLTELILAPAANGVAVQQRTGVVAVCSDGGDHGTWTEVDGWQRVTHLARGGSAVLSVSKADRLDKQRRHAPAYGKPSVYENIRKFVALLVETGKSPYIRQMASSTVPASSKAEPRSVRLEARMPARIRELVVHAARLRGRSVSEFVVSAAEEAAKRTIEEDAVFRVSIEDQRRLVAALSKPARPTAALRKAIKSSNKLIAPE